MIYTEIHVTLYVQLYVYWFILHFGHPVSCCLHHTKLQQACTSTPLPITHNVTFCNGRNMNYVTMTQAQAQTRNHVLRKYWVIKNDCRGFNVIHNTLETGVCSCTDGSRNSQSFLLWCSVCSRYAFLRLERSLLRWRRTAVKRRFVWNELDYLVDVCRITKGAHIEHL